MNFIGGINVNDVSVRVMFNRLPRSSIVNQNDGIESDIIVSFFVSAHGARKYSNINFVIGGNEAEASTSADRLDDSVFFFRSLRSPGRGVKIWGVGLSHGFGLVAAL